MLLKDSKYIWHPFSQMMQETSILPIDSAKNSLLFYKDSAGKQQEIIDAISSWWVITHGHCNENLIEAATDQIKKLDQVIFAGCTHQPAVNFAENLITTLGQPFSKVFYSDNGSTSVEIAVKMAIQYHKQVKKKVTSKPKIIVALENSYHGDTFGGMSISGRGVLSGHFSEYLFEVKHIPYPINIESSIEALKKINNEYEIITIILEPLVQGAAGMKMYSIDALKSILEFAKENEILTIFDEVFTGFGRTEKLFAFQNIHNLTPDFLCLSKGISGGMLPLAATVTTDQIYDAFLDSTLDKAFLHGHSFTGNAIALAVADENLKLLKSTESINSRININAKHKEFIQTLEKNAHVFNPRVLGTILAFDLNTSSKGYTGFQFRDEIRKFAIENNVLLRPIGNTIYTAPPYCITNEQLYKIYDLMCKILEQYI